MMRWLRSEKGFLTFEWSYLLIITLFLIIVLLPDMIGIGRAQFHIQQASSFAVQQAAQQGHMTQEIAQNTAQYLEERNVRQVKVLGTEEQQSFSEPVEVQVVGHVKPLIFSMLPDMQVSDGVEIEDGMIALTAHKMDASNVYVR